MGACFASIFPEDEESEDTYTNRNWKAVAYEAEAQELYECEGTINGQSSRDQLEFRALLDYPIALTYIDTFIKAKAASFDMSFLCWQNIREYHELPKTFNQLPVAQALFDVYVRDNNYIDEPLRLRTEQAIKHGTTHPQILKRAFDLVYVKLFLLLYQEVYVVFRETPEFQDLRLQISLSYNHVLAKDFEIFEVLGKGGFGLVCEVRKKSTGTRHAMKIQAKEGVMKAFGDEPWRACLEMRAFASCKHPYIVELQCAFQTESLLFLVMTRGTWCDLSKVLRLGGPLDYSHVRFYSAEITSALSYLHSKHFLYRDLKPANVLLNLDGHIQLVDFGAVGDLDGALLEQCCTLRSEPEVPLSLFRDSDPCVHKSVGVSESYMSGKLNQDSYHNTNSYPTDGAMGSTNNEINSSTPTPSVPIPKRARSLVGTYGYMAPEIAVLLGEQSRLNSGYDIDRLNHGYTRAVDWWSLGVLVYKLLVGEYPFRCGHSKEAIPTWEILNEPVNYSMPALSENANTRDFISSLLTVDDTKRLGSDPEGSSAVRQHPFFGGIDWELLEGKNLTPPKLPIIPFPGGSFLLSQKPQYGSVEQVLEAHKRLQWLTFGSTEQEMAQQHHFGAWEYTSPSIIAAEIDYIASKSMSHSQSHSQREQTKSMSFAHMTPRSNRISATTGTGSVVGSSTLSWAVKSINKALSPAQ